MEATLKVRKLKKYISVVLILLMLMLPLSALAGEDTPQSSEETSKSQVEESSESKSSVNEESKVTENSTEKENESKEESKETKEEESKESENENNEEHESKDKEEQESEVKEEVKEEESAEKQSEEAEESNEEQKESKDDEEETQQFMMMSMDDEFGIMSEHDEDVDLEFEIVPDDGKHAQGQLNYHVDLDVTETDGEEVEGYEDPIQELLFELTYYLSKVSNAQNHNLAQVEMDVTSPDGGSLIVANGFSATDLNVSITGGKSWSYEVNTFYDTDNDVTYLLGLKLFANVVSGNTYGNVLGNDGDSVSVAFNATPTLPGLYEFEVAAHLYREQGQGYVVEPIKYMGNSGSTESVVIGPLDSEDPDPDDPDPDDPEPDDPDPEVTDPDDPDPDDTGLPFLPEAISFILPDPTEPEEAATLLAEFVPVDLEPEEVVEELVIALEEPQVVPEAVETQVLIQSPNLWWLLLLLLAPVLIWFLLARMVLIRVPNEKGEYETVARKIARRKEKRWFVEIEKQLNEHLTKHGEVLVDFRGGLIQEAKKAIYNGENLLSTGEVRYAIVNRQRSTVWVEELQKKQERIAG